MSYKREKSILFFRRLSLLFFSIIDSITTIVYLSIILLQISMGIKNGTYHKLKRITIKYLQYKKTSNKSTK